MKDVKADESVMIVIAFLVRKSFLYLSTQRNVEGLIKYFMKFENCSEFSKALPTATSFAMGKANQFPDTLLKANALSGFESTQLMKKKHYHILAK